MRWNSRVFVTSPLSPPCYRDIARHFVSFISLTLSISTTPSQLQTPDRKNELRARSMLPSLGTINRINSADSTRFLLSLPRRTPIPTRTYFTGLTKHTPTRSISLHRKAAHFSMETDRRQPDTTATDDFVHIEQKDLSSSQTIEGETSNSNSNSNSNLDENENSVEKVLNSDDVAGENDASTETVDESEIMKGVVLLECESAAEGGRCDVYLVGTAHVSTESCREVQAVISYLKPQVVFLELCSSRVGILTPQNLRVPTMNEMVHMWKKKNTNAFGILYSWFLAKVASKLEVFPGSEFRVAYEEAMKYGGKVVLGDRPVNITLRRTWVKMKLWHKVKFLYSMFFQAMFLPSSADLVKMLKEMDDVDMLTLVVQEMSKQFPTLMETLLHERDLYMSSTLLSVAREHTSVVAVVGKGHLQGIKKNWKQPVQLQELLTIPARKSGVSMTRILTSLGVAVAGAAIISGIYYGAKR